ncbi:hypothetical protein [Streptomyces sp. B1I3]|uniref:hypothetical protein n=1 Tax=Streptomyces sp. B1I3 TaxID=3042264 RepID=UPI00277D97F7|nr:hypothetical protein [Streptomyces sp. B1I3]MDQ0793850.1 hypothetical protein [Streptomyces sp. B1I3]
MKTTPSTTSPATDDATADVTEEPTENVTKDATEDKRTVTDAHAAPRSTKATDAPGAVAPQDDATEGDATEDEDLGPDPYDEAEAAASTGSGSGAAAVVAAGLGIVSLSGAWTGRVAAERETLIGQIKTSGGGSAAQQISEIYGDAWHSTALVNGLFALLALLIGVLVLVRPAFGAPAGRPRPGWIRSVALAGVALGVLGVLISAGMYLDLIVSLPNAGG